MSGLPTLDPSRCAGSGDCVAACPTACLEMAGPLVWMPRPADCAGCGVCAAVCPTRAIRLEPPAGAPPDDEGHPR